MKLIVTRPEPAASKTADKLRALGHDVIISPLLEIVDSGVDMPSGNFCALIVTSANALGVMEQRGVGLKLLRMPLYVVGDRTAEKAMELGFENVLSASGNAQNLIELLAADTGLAKDGKNPLLYICGADATLGFVETLEKNGLSITRWVNYKANLVDQLTNKSAEFICSENLTGILLYSARTARQLSQIQTMQTPTQAFDNIKIFAISDNVKSALTLPLQKRCLVAKNPNELSLFKLIQV